jgi:DSBA-like thioredoxin domain
MMMIKIIFGPRLFPKMRRPTSLIFTPTPVALICIKANTQWMEHVVMLRSEPFRPPNCQSAPKFSLWELDFTSRKIRDASGIRFCWRPFHLLVILREMKHVPFADKPTKSAYMWRDIERRAVMYGIPASLPAPYPAKQSIMANLVASVGMRQGWGVDFVRAAYRRWLQFGQETGSEPNLSESLRDIGVEPSRYSHWQTPPRQKPLSWRKRPLPETLVSSVRQLSSLGVSFFGAMIALRTRSAGTDTAACKLINRAPQFCGIFLSQTASADNARLHRSRRSLY